MKNWYEVNNVAELDSPSLLLYKERVASNIDKMIAIAGGTSRLAVHVKTNKMPEVVKMMLAKGIAKFKCATIAEAEMAAMAGAKFIIIAHQLVGPKIDRLIQLHQKYQDVMFASLIDCEEILQETNQKFADKDLTAAVLVDVNNGMNRSGYDLDEHLEDFCLKINSQSNLQFLGLHAYDGHLRDADFGIRKAKIEEGFKQVTTVFNKLQTQIEHTIYLVSGGTPAFTSHATETERLCSPGTCVLWDWGYGDVLQEQPFDYAALILTRVISKPAKGLVAIDMGHKALASENPINKRIRFLNLTDYELLSQSEEHGVLRVEDWENIKVGDVLYGVPYHICPTINLYDEVNVIEQNQATTHWQILGRKRRIEV